MKAGLDRQLLGWIETFSCRQQHDLLPQLKRPDGSPALHHRWGQRNRPDWDARGLVIWPRGGQRLHLTHSLHWPQAWGQRKSGETIRLALRWWAEAAECRINGSTIHRGDLFDTACRWPLPEWFGPGEVLEVELLLQSPRHDDGALLLAQLEREPNEPSDPDGLLLASQLKLLQQDLPAADEELEALLQGDPNNSAAVANLRHWLRQQQRAPGLTLLSHAHLDLAWLWPVADTWQAAERTFRSVLGLMQRHPELHFGHSTPALYAWLQQHRPALFAEIQETMQQGRWEPLNGPWVESDCTLVASASLLRQFQEGQAYSQQHLPGWEHALAWLPDSFGFSSGVPAICRASGVQWFCTHKLFWNSTNPFPHRVFRWRHCSGDEVLALMSAPIGTSGDPLAMAAYSQQWQRSTGIPQGLWLPGVGDHGGGPSQEMLEQLQLWQEQPLSAPTEFGTVRSYLNELEAHQGQLPLWRDELYLELHRGCATSRPDQKRHNRTLERLLLEADLAQALSGQQPSGQEQWRTLLFQQFHDILPGTSVPEVFEQAEPQWRQARRLSRQRRDQALAASLPLKSQKQPQWWVANLLPTIQGSAVVRLPSPPDGQTWCDHAGAVPVQPARSGGCWLQIQSSEDVGAQRLVLGSAAETSAKAQGEVSLDRDDNGELWLSNGHLQAKLGPRGVEHLQQRRGDGWGEPLLAEAMALHRYGDRGEFWDAWDIASDYTGHALPMRWEAEEEQLESGPLCTQLRWRGHCGQSPLQLSVRLQAGSPWLELIITAQWRQLHELLRCEWALNQPGHFWSADTPGGVQERSSRPRTPREQARWEATAISWLWGGTNQAGLAVLLDGPQGVSGNNNGLGVSLLRGPTWPDPSADQGWHRLRMALMPTTGSWHHAAVAAQARRFRQPLWRHPAAAGPAERRSWLAWPNPHQHWLGFDSAADGGLQWQTQNLSPCRSQWPAASGPWQIKHWPWEMAQSS